MRTVAEIRNQKQSKLNDVLIAIMSFRPWDLMSILDNDRTYQDVSLLEFVEKVQEKLKRFEALGDSELFLDIGVCKLCHQNEPIFIFMGNVTKFRYALYFEFEKEKITDIYKCTLYRDSTEYDEK